MIKRIDEFVTESGFDYLSFIGSLEKGDRSDCAPFRKEIGKDMQKVFDKLSETRKSIMVVFSKLSPEELTRLQKSPSSKLQGTNRIFDDLQLFYLLTGK